MVACSASRCRESTFWHSTAGYSPEPLALQSLVWAGEGADAISARAMPIAELVQRFESVGDNCEFGLVQRRCGAEPLGLFRFGSVQVPNLVRGLETGFAGLGEADRLRLGVEGGAEPAWMMLDPSYDVHDHTFIPERDKPASRRVEDEIKRLGYL